MNIDEQQSAPHRSTLRVISALEALAQSEEPLSLTDICSQLKAPKSSIFPIVHTLLDLGYITQDPMTKLYSIGLKTYLLGKSYKQGNDLFNIFTTSMQRIVDSCGETCQLGTLDEGRVLYVSKIDSPQAIRLISHVGVSLPIHFTALGKIMSSLLPDQEIKDLLEDPFSTPTKHTLKTHKEFFEQLQIVRSQGYAIDDEEATEGVCCVAVALDLRPQAIYGLSVTAPTYRMSEEKLNHIIRVLKEEKQELMQLI